MVQIDNIVKKNTITTLEMPNMLELPRIRTEDSGEP